MQAHTLSRAVLVTACLVLACGCTSQLIMTGQSAQPALTGAANIAATLTSGSGGSVVTISSPENLPVAVRQANNLKVAFGGTEVAVTRSAAGAYMFTVPSTAKVHQDVDGNLRVVFVVDDSESQIVTLVTASPLSYGTPAIATLPNPGYLAHGQSVQLTANTTADPARFNFTWSYGTSASGPWTAIPGSGKQVTWTPPASGSFFVRVDAGDRQTNLSYPAIPSTPLVIVTDASGVITTVPTGGSVALGTSVTLKYNAPASGSAAAHYAWSWAAAATGPWTSIVGDTPSLSWLPATSGPLFLQVAVADQAGNVSTYQTSQAALFINSGGAPITASPQLLQRGATATLSVAIDASEAGPFSWYYAKSTSTASSTASSWVSLGSGGRTLPFIPTDVGAYVFRVDVPQATGGLRSFVDTDPALTVVEDKPLVTPAQQTIQRGDRDTMTLNLAGVTATSQPTWYYAKEGGTTPAWTLMSGNGLTNDFVADQAGIYDFRVDVAQADGTVKSFTTTNPVLNVIDAGPLIVSDPVNDIASQGGDVTLTLNARGVDETHYKFIWSVGSGANGPFTTLPFTNVNELYTKHFTWSIPSSFAPGPYYVQVQAIQVDGNATYTFTSGVPVFTVQK